LSGDHPPISVFDDENAVTYALLEGTTGPRHAVTNGGVTVVDYMVKGFELAPDERATHAFAIGAHAGGSETPKRAGNLATVAREDHESIPEHDSGSGSNQPPSAGVEDVPSSVSNGSTITLDASGSTDPDGDDSQLEYSWSVASEPSDTSATPPDGPQGDVTLTAPGTYEFEVAVTDAQGEADTAAVTVTVEPEPDSVGDFQNEPTDPDGDGTYEDVNGDGNVNVLDAQAIFANTDDPVVESNVDAFDFNDDGSVNVLDAQALFADG
jgi:hypothetical protein